MCQCVCVPFVFCDDYVCAFIGALYVYVRVCFWPTNVNSQKFRQRFHFIMWKFIKAFGPGRGILIALRFAHATYAHCLCRYSFGLSV